ncbi:MAG: UTP--glucose-1-phosphate uridylyltransferase [Lachnospiraceae bacterium]
MTKEEAERKLEQNGQNHILRFYDELSKKQQQELLTQIEETDFQQIKQAQGIETARGNITPIEVMQREEITRREEELTKIGLEVLKQGKVGLVLLAGGMGTRLGSDDPKGMYDIGEKRPQPIFSRIIANLLEVTTRSETVLNLFIMTSEKNHDKTVTFFQENEYFGYPKEYIYFFPQEMAPATDFEGKVYLEEKGRIATSPNGNGGWFTSMGKAGLWNVLKEQNILWLNVFAVDNVLQRMADPIFIGAVTAGNYATGSKVIKKADPEEKVGVICLEDGKPSIVEYYELTQQMLTEKGPDGTLSYNFGVILNYLFHVEELYSIVQKKLPLHVVEKKIPYINKDGQRIKPQQPNGHKYESLILDMIHFMDHALAFEVIREKEFAPIKNKTGIDSVESAKELLRKNQIEV